jgi:hypothetical protein
MAIFKQGFRDGLCLPCLDILKPKLSVDDTFMKQPAALQSFGRHELPVPVNIP